MSFLDSLLGGIKAVLSSGTLQPQEPGINFTGAGVTVTDDPSNGFTTVTIPGGAAGDRTYVVPQTFGAVPDGTTDASGAFNAMIAASAGKDVLISGGVFKLSNNVTFPSTINVTFGRDSSVTVSAGKTLTFNGPIITDPYHQIFSGAGTTTFGLNSQPSVSPYWWGATGVGGDDTTALNAAVAAAISANAPLVLDGIFGVSSTISIGGTVGGFGIVSGLMNHLPSKSSLIWVGSSGGGPILKIQDAYRGYISGVTFNCNNVGGYGLQFVHFPGVDTFPIEGWTIDNCEFSDAKTYNLLIGRKDADIAADQGDVSLLQFRNCLFVNNSLSTPTVAHVRHRASNGFGTSFIGCQFIGHGASGPSYAVYMQSGDLNFYSCVTVEIETFDLFLETGGNTVNVPPSVKIYGWEAQSRNFLKADFSSSAIATQRPTVISGVIHSDISSPRAGTKSVVWNQTSTEYGALYLEDSHFNYEVNLVAQTDVYVSNIVFDMAFGGGFTGSVNKIRGTWKENASNKSFRNEGYGSFGISGDTTFSFSNVGNEMVVLTGSPAADFNIVFPTIDGYSRWFLNSTNKVATIKTAAGTGVALIPGESAMVMCDGTNIVRMTSDTHFYGTGSPNGAVTASPGSIFIASDTGKAWSKLSGTGNTGWSELLGVSSAGVLSSAVDPIEAPNSFKIDGHLTMGATAASSGAIRMSKATAILFNDNAGTGNITGLATDGSDNVFVGDPTHTVQTRIAGNNAGGAGQVQNGNASGYSGFELTDSGGTVKAAVAWSNGASHTRVNSLGGPIFLMISSSTKLAVDGSGNGVQFFNSGTSDLGGGTDVIGITNASVVPSSAPAAGGVIYEEGGALKHLGSGGTKTVLAPA